MPSRNHREQQQEEHLQFMRAQTAQIMMFLMGLLPMYQQAFSGAAEAGRDQCAGPRPAGHARGGRAGRGRGGHAVRGRGGRPDEDHHSDHTSDESGLLVGLAGPPPPPPPAGRGASAKSIDHQGQVTFTTIVLSMMAIATMSPMTMARKANLRPREGWAVV